MDRTSKCSFIFSSQEIDMGFICQKKNKKTQQSVSEEEKNWFKKKSNIYCNTIVHYL